MIRTFARDLENQNLDDYFAETMGVVWDPQSPIRVLTISALKRTPDGTDCSEPMEKYIAQWSPFR